MLTLKVEGVRRTKSGNKVNLYSCECGGEAEIVGSNVRNGHTRSCGCMGGRDTHGMSNTREYTTWCMMRKRCTNQNSECYADYGGRGITVCDRWDSFENFYEDMGPRPEGMTLDRIDNDKGYDKDNCRWATKKEQQNNKRDNIFVTAYGQTLTLSEWAELMGIPRTRLYSRVRQGWSLDWRIITAPKGARRV